MRIIDKKIRCMGGKIIGGIADITVIFTDGSIYRFKGDIRNGAGSHSIMPAIRNIEKSERRRAS
ncbi:MAG: hypothetical protein IKN12_06405 [Selenomonadaceae bacterium]|nr:hypothetical protein [Selenomonadaceae bacterium]